MKEAIKNFMIEKAKHLFEMKGYDETTIEDIAKASSISIPTVYNYFPSKNDIFSEVVKSIDKQFNEEVFPIFTSDMDFFKKLEKLIGKLIEFVKKNKEIVRISFFESHVYTNIKRIEESEVWKNKEKRLERLIILIEEGIEKGFVDNTIKPENISAFIMGMMHEIFFRIIFANKAKEINIDDTINDLMNFIKTGIKKR